MSRYSSGNSLENFVWRAEWNLDGMVNETHELFRLQFDGKYLISSLKLKAKFNLMFKVTFFKKFKSEKSHWNFYEIWITNFVETTHNHGNFKKMLKKFNLYSTRKKFSQTLHEMPNLKVCSSIKSFFMVLLKTHKQLSWITHYPPTEFYLFSKLIRLLLQTHNRHATKLTTNFRMTRKSVPFSSLKKLNGKTVYNFANGLEKRDNNEKNRV